MRAVVVLILIVMGGAIVLGSMIEKVQVQQDQLDITSEHLQQATARVEALEKELAAAKAENTRSQVQLKRLTAERDQFQWQVEALTTGCRSSQAPAKASSWNWSVLVSAPLAAGAGWAWLRRRRATGLLVAHTGLDPEESREIVTVRLPRQALKDYLRWQRHSAQIETWPEAKPPTASAISSSASSTDLPAARQPFARSTKRSAAEIPSLSRTVSGLTR